MTHPNDELEKAAQKHKLHGGNGYTGFKAGAAYGRRAERERIIGKLKAIGFMTESFERALAGEEK